MTKSQPDQAAVVNAGTGAADGTSNVEWIAPAGIPACRQFCAATRWSLLAALLERMRSLAATGFGEELTRSELRGKALINWSRVWKDMAELEAALPPEPIQFPVTARPRFSEEEWNSHHAARIVGGSNGPTR